MQKKQLTLFLVKYSSPNKMHGKEESYLWRLSGGSLEEIRLCGGYSWEGKGTNYIVFPSSKFQVLGIISDKVIYKIMFSVHALVSVCG